MIKDLFYKIKHSIIIFLKVEIRKIAYHQTERIVVNDLMILPSYKDRSA